MVVMISVVLLIFRIRPFPPSATIIFPAGSQANPCGQIVARVALMLSPLKPQFPVPAYVVITPVVLILRMRLPKTSATYTLPALSTSEDVGPPIAALVAG